MTKEGKSKLNKKWWAFCDEIEDKIEDVMYVGDGLFSYSFCLYGSC